MRSEPLVSIVMAARNAEPFLADAIQSCLSQTWDRTEIIVVDDGSTDNSGRVARAFTSNKLAVESCSHRGQSAAQNYGIRFAQGDLIKCVDADDILHPDCVRLQVSRLAGRDDAVATGEVRTFWRTLADARPAAETVRSDLGGPEWLKASLFLSGFPGLHAFLIPRELFDRAGHWNERLSMENDSELAARIMLQAREVLFTPGAYYFYRFVPSSLSRRTTAETIESSRMAYDLIIEALLPTCDTPPTRLLCANLLRKLEFQYGYDRPEWVVALDARINELGGAKISPSGGFGFHAARFLIGWRNARRLERWVLKHGLNRSALAKRLVSKSIP